MWTVCGWHVKLHGKRGILLLNSLIKLPKHKSIPFSQFSFIAIKQSTHIPRAGSAFSQLMLKQALCKRMRNSTLVRVPVPHPWVINRHLQEAGASLQQEWLDKESSLLFSIQPRNCKVHNHKYLPFLAPPIQYSLQHQCRAIRNLIMSLWLKNHTTILANSLTSQLLLFSPALSSQSRELLQRAC